MSSPDAVPRSRRSVARREGIAAAAARTFAERGYAAVGMRDVAEAVGIRGASLYHHFGSEDEILYAICLTVTEEPNPENLLLLDAPGTPATRLTALVRGHRRHLHHRRVEHLVGLHELAGLTAERRAVVDEHRRFYLRRVAMSSPPGSRRGSSRCPMRDWRPSRSATCSTG